MSEEPASNPPAVFEGLDDPLREQLPTFEVFFKTFGFKRIHGRIWGLLVLAGQPLSSKQIGSELGISSGATSTTLNELSEWGAITSCFDSTRRCHLHSPVGNTLSIVATVLRRREQVIFSQFKTGATRTLKYVTERYGSKDPRALTLRSIISSCEIAEAVMQLVFSSVSSALGDSESVLSKAVHAALKIGMVPARIFTRGGQVPLEGAGLETGLDTDLDEDLEQTEAEARTDGDLDAQEFEVAEARARDAGGQDRDD